MKNMHYWMIGIMVIQALLLEIYNEPDELWIIRKRPVWGIFAIAVLRVK